MRTYYDILEVDREATEEEIKRSYRRLVLRWHPDKNPDDLVAAEHFLLIQEAYEQLSDYRRRSEYNDKLDGKYQEPVRVYYQPYTPPYEAAEIAKKKKKRSLLIVIPIFTLLMAAIGLMVYLFVNNQDPVYVNSSRDSSLPASQIYQTRSISGRDVKPQDVNQDSATSSVDSIFRSSLTTRDQKELVPTPTPAPKADSKKVEKPKGWHPDPILEASYE